MRKILFTPFIFIAAAAFAQDVNKINVIPAPAEVKELGGPNFTITKKTTILLEGNEPVNIAGLFNYYLQEIYGMKLRISKTEPENNAIVISYKKSENATVGSYSLNIHNDRVYIAADNEPGLFYGMQTLLQLLPSIHPKPMATGSQIPNLKLEIPQLLIKDYPRFQYRGIHLDVGRHFFSPAFIKKYIDYLAWHKFNYFHWHLTEDQGWRIEIKQYPLLTSVGGYRNGTIVGHHPGKGNDSVHYGGFYTQEQVKDIVKYAAERYITIIPEIEMPGHASAAIAAYPQLSCFPRESTKIPATTPWAGSREGKQVQQTWGVFEDVFCPSEYTFKFLENVLDEVMQLFPSTYIHIGGDECPKESWKRSDFCQRLIKSKNLKDEHGLQSYFIQRIEKYLNTKGRKIIGWDEILEGGIAPNATVMSWRGEEGGITAAKEKHDVIMTPDSYMYLNYSQTKNEDSLTIGGYLPLQTVYNYEPVPAALHPDEAKHILGAQGNLWTEYTGNEKILEYMLFPRMSAVSEVVWSPKEKRNWKDFDRRLPALLARYKMWGANYNKAFYDLKGVALPTEDFNGVLWKLETNNRNAEIRYSLPGENSGDIKYEKPVLITRDQMYIAFLNDKGERSSNSIHQQFHFNKATGKKITLKDQPQGKYSGSGGFTLVNGIIAEATLDQSQEWLGFDGSDLEAVIDLGKQENINKIGIDILHQEGSWVYPPSSVGFFISDNGYDFVLQELLEPGNDHMWPADRRIEVKLNNASARFIKVVAKNYGSIPAGRPGAGNPAWLFADEIIVE